MIGVVGARQEMKEKSKGNVGREVVVKTGDV